MSIFEEWIREPLIRLDLVSTIVKIWGTYPGKLGSSVSSSPVSAKMSGNHGIKRKEAWHKTEGSMA